MNLNGDLMRLLMATPFVRMSETVDWRIVDDRAYATDEDLLRAMHHRVASSISKIFVDHCLAHGHLVTSREPEGLRIAMVAYCLTRDQLVDLLQKAFDLGRSHESSVRSIEPFHQPSTDKGN